MLSIVVNAIIYILLVFYYKQQNRLIDNKIRDWNVLYAAICAAYRQAALESGADLATLDSRIKILTEENLKATHLKKAV